MQIYAGKSVIDESLLDPTKGNGVTKVVDGKYVLRPSSLNIHCPYQYAQNALLGKKSKPSGASAGGTAYHYALELGYQEKILTGQNPSVEDIVAIGVANWDKVQQVEELHYSTKDSPAKMTDDIANGLRAYHPAIARTTPIATEIRWSVALPKPSSVYSMISGSVDLLALSSTVKPNLGGGSVSEQGVEIIDHKFTSKKSTSPKYKLQAGLYEIMGNANLPITKGLEHLQVSGTVLHNMVRSEKLKTKNNPTRLELVRPERGAAVVQNIASRVTELLDRAEMFHFMKTDLHIDPEDAVKILYPTTTPEVSFLCNELWCGFWDICPMNNSQAIPKINLVDILKQFKEKTHG